MVNAIVLLKVKREKINSVANKVVQINGVSEVYTVAGQYDMVAVVRAPNDEVFTEVVTKGMLDIEGIKASETLIAFKAYSSYDLEAIFG